MGKDREIIQASAVSIGGRALVMFGKPGSGKSSLALALIDRGAILIGDDGVALYRDSDNSVIASPPPNISGKLEIRGVGIVNLPTAQSPVALAIDLDTKPDRLPISPQTRELVGVEVPLLPFSANAPNSALRAEWALREHGTKAGDECK